MTTETETKFIHTIFGKLLRWLIFIPAGLILILILDFLLMVFVDFIFENDLKLFLVVGLFFGVLFMVIPFSYLLYGAIGKLTTSIAPNPKLASFIFTPVIILISIFYIYNWQNMNLPNFWTISIMKSLTTLFVIRGLFDENL
jgi:hypothetical protein